MGMTTHSRLLIGIAGGLLLSVLGVMIVDSPPDIPTQGDPIRPQERSSLGPAPLEQPSGSDSDRTAVESTGTSAGGLPSQEEYLRGRILLHTGEPLVGADYHWRIRHRQTPYHEGKTGGQGEWSVPREIAEIPESFLCVEVTEVFWLCCHKLDPRASLDEATIRVPELSSLTLAIVDQTGGTGPISWTPGISLTSFRGRPSDNSRFTIFDSFEGARTAPTIKGIISEGGLPFDTFSGYLPARDRKTRTLSIPREGQYRVSCSTRFTASPEYYDVAPPSTVTFAITRPTDPRPLVRLFEDGVPVDADGRGVWRRGNGSVDFEIEGGQWRLPARNVDDTDRIAIMLSDGRLLIGFGSDLVLVLKKSENAYRMEVGQGVASFTVQSLAEIPIYAKATKGDGSSCVIYRQGNMGWGLPFFVVEPEATDAMRVYGLADEWTDLWFMGASGLVQWAGRFAYPAPEARNLEVRRVLSVDFSERLARLVRWYGKVSVRCEVRLLVYDGPWLPVDTITLRNEVDAQGVVWNKVETRGADTRIRVRYRVGGESVEEVIAN